MSAYAEWIEAHLDPNDLLQGRGRCHTLSQQMAKEFPELRLVAGFYYCSVWGQQQHWWCVAPDGSVVDPTAGQFPSSGNGVYEEVAPEDRPIGKCMYCGGLVYPGRFEPMCSEECSVGIQDSFNRRFEI